MIRKFTCLFFCCCFFSQHTTATPITFDLRSDFIETIDEVTSFQLNGGDVVATLSSSMGLLNRTSASFGVNATGSGDATSLIDNGSGIAEFIQIQFNKTVSLLDFTVSSFGSSDVGLLSVNGLSIFDINSSGFNDTNGIFITDADLLTLSFIAGNGFSFDSFTIDQTSVFESTVNEPGSGFLLLSGLLLFSIQKYRKLKNI